MNIEIDLIIEKVKAILDEFNSKLFKIFKGHKYFSFGYGRRSVMSEEYGVDRQIFYDFEIMFSGESIIKFSVEYEELESHFLTKSLNEDMFRKEVIRYFEVAETKSRLTKDALNSEEQNDMFDKSVKEALKQ